MNSKVVRENKLKNITLLEYLEIRNKWCPTKVKNKVSSGNVCGNSRRALSWLNTCCGASIISFPCTLSIPVVIIMGLPMASWVSHCHWFQLCKLLGPWNVFLGCVLETTHISLNNLYGVLSSTWKKSYLYGNSWTTSQD